MKKDQVKSEVEVLHLFRWFTHTHWVAAVGAPKMAKHFRAGTQTLDRGWSELTSRIGTEITAKYRKRGLINPELFEYVFSWMWRCNAGHLCARAVSEQRRLNRLKGSKKELSSNPHIIPDPNPRPYSPRAQLVRALPCCSSQKIDYQITAGYI